MDQLTPMKQAIEARDVGAVARLLEAGVNPRRQGEDGSTAVYWAAWYGPRERVELLIRQNAKTWMADKEGKLPIDYARAGLLVPTARTDLHGYLQPLKDLTIHHPPLAS